MVVLRRSEKGGEESMEAVGEALCSNIPTTFFVLKVVEAVSEKTGKGELPSLQQLEAAMSKLAQSCLHLVASLCADAKCQPLELFTRSTQCSTHLRAQRSFRSGEAAARQQRLQAIAASLALSAPKSRDREAFEKLRQRMHLLAQHGVPRKTCAIILFALHETILLLDADKVRRRRAKQKELPLAAGAATGFSACIDHMLPGGHSGHGSPPGKIQIRCILVCLMVQLLARQGIGKLAMLRTNDMCLLQVLWMDFLSMKTRISQAWLLC